MKIISLFVVLTAILVSTLLALPTKIREQERSLNLNKRSDQDQDQDRYTTSQHDRNCACDSCYQMKLEAPNVYFGRSTDLIRNSVAQALLAPSMNMVDTCFGAVENGFNKARRQDIERQRREWLQKQEHQHSRNVNRAGTSPVDSYQRSNENDVYDEARHKEVARQYLEWREGGKHQNRQEANRASGSQIDSWYWSNETYGYDAEASLDPLEPEPELRTRRRGGRRS